MHGYLRPRVQEAEPKTVIHSQVEKINREEEAAKQRWVFRQIRLQPSP